jgi:type IV pilus assembly protein PilA
MNVYSDSQRKGFTLLEILLVIAAIGILAAIVLVAINPNRQLAQTRNAQRRSDINTILNAVYQNIIDNSSTGTPSILTTITTSRNIIRIDDVAVCSTPADSLTGTNIPAVTTAINLATALTTNGTYLPSIPRDPQATVANCTDYVIARDTNNRITVEAPRTESPATADLSATK